MKVECVGYESKYRQHTFEMYKPVCNVEKPLSNYTI